MGKQVVLGQFSEFQKRIFAIFLQTVHDYSLISKEQVGFTAH